jgi:hypothetical protein
LSTTGLKIYHRHFSKWDDIYSRKMKSNKTHTRKKGEDIRDISCLSADVGGGIKAPGPKEPALQPTPAPQKLLPDQLFPPNQPLPSSQNPPAGQEATPPPSKRPRSSSRWRKKNKSLGRILPVRRAAFGQETVHPEDLTGLAKWKHEDKMSIVPAKYYHEKARRDKIPEGCVNRSRRRPTKKETFLQQLVDYEQNAIESGAKTWAEIPKATQKLMEEQLSTETIANLKAAKNQITDEGLKIVADDLLYRTGHTFDDIQEFKANKLMDGEEVKKVARDYKAGKITQGDAINQLGKMVRDAVNPDGEAPQPIPTEIGPAPEAAPPKEVWQTPRDEFIANDPSRQPPGGPLVASQSFIEESFAGMKLKRIDNLEEKMETTTDTKPGKTPSFEFDADIQRKIVAMIILDQSLWPEAKEIARPEFFDNPVHAGLIRLAHKFYDEYQHPLTVDEFCQECLEALAREMKPEAEAIYLEEFGKVIQAGEGADFSYVRNKLHAWARSQAVKNAFLKGVDLYEEGDYEAIGQLFIKALAVGNEKDTEGLDDIVAADVQEQPIEWLWHHILPKAALSVIIGMPTSGKSWFSMMVAARVSAGRPFPNHEQFKVAQGRVLILQSEDSWASTCTRRLRLEGADMSQVHFVKGMKHKDATRPVDLSTDLEKVRQRMRELGNVKLIIVDPLDAYIGLTRHFDTHKGREVRLALRPLEIFIETEQVAVLGIMHLNKSQMSAVIHRISGSAAWAQVPRAIWAIVLKRDTPDVRQFLSVKSNTVRDVDRRLAEFCFRISEEQNRIELAPDEEPGNVSEELAPARPEDVKDRSTKLALAIAVLEEIKDSAADGLPAAAIMNAVPEIGEATWMTARRRASWTTRQTRNGWYWYPPKADPSQK